MNERVTYLTSGADEIGDVATQALSVGRATTSIDFVLLSFALALWEERVLLMHAET